MQNDDRWENDNRSILHRYRNVVRRELWLIIGCAVAAAFVAAAVALSLPSVYSASATLWIEFDEPGVVMVGATHGLDTRAQRYYETQLEILRSRRLVDAVIDELDLLSEPEFRSSPRTQTSSWRALLPTFLAPRGSSVRDERADAIERYRDRLSIVPVDGTLIVRVGFDSSQPRLAADVANAHARAYVEMMRELSAGSEVTTWPQGRFDRQGSVADSEHAEPILGGSESTTAQRSMRLADLRQRLAEYERPYRRILEARSSAALQSISEISNDPSVQASRNRFADAQQEVAELGKRYGPMHPTMITALAERDRAKAELDERRAAVAERIRRDYEGALAEENALGATLTIAHALQNEQESDTGSIDQPLGLAGSPDPSTMRVERVGPANEPNGLSIADARVIESALAPRTPVKPQKLVIVGGAFAGAIVIGMLIALINDSLTNTLRSVRDIEERLRRPMLSIVPLLAPRRLKNVQNGIIEDGPYRESMRTLRSSVLLDNCERTHKVVLVTSAVNEEGKSTIALNLAAAFAATGKVLIIDADMRRPTIGRLLDLPRYDAGLSELVTRRAPFKSCLAKTKIPNLHVIRTGFIPSDPLELFAHRRLAKILRVLAQAYDQIVIDAPAILAVSDAAVLSKYVDAVVFVAKAASTPVPLIEDGLSLLKRVDAPITGVVLNQLDMRKAAKYTDARAGAHRVPAASPS